MPDDEFNAALRRLSLPAAADPSGLSRRRFLQATLGGLGTAALLPSWFASGALAAPPIGATDGVLVVVLMGGGNDGLNMVVPTGDSAYYANRGSIAISAGSALGIAPGFGLHPNLTGIKSLWDQGNLAVVQGVGPPVPDLSHFTSMANWMAGVTTGPPSTGWLGRYLDGLGAPDPLRGVVIGTSTPLHCIGATTVATALPQDLSGAFGADQSDPTDLRMFDTIRSYADAPSGLGVWGDELAVSGSQTMDLGVTVAPMYLPTLPEGNLARPMALCARLINANLGLRVLACSYGDFDSHAGERTMHDARMAELDAAVTTFYGTLDASYRTRVTIMTFSEFGRRVPANESDGTDHGEASSLFVIGDNVAGGLYGQYPSLTALHDGNLVANVDYRSVYASVLGGWLDADANQILGGAYEDLGLFASGPGG